MKKLTLIIIGLLFLNANTVFGQSQSDTIQIKKSLGTIFIQNGERFKPNQLLEIIKINPEAYTEMKVAKSNHNIGSVFAFAGRFLVGWPLGTAIAG